jgi:hypothetical protein
MELLKNEVKLAVCDNLDSNKYYYNSAGLVSPEIIRCQQTCISF